MMTMMMMYSYQCAHMATYSIYTSALVDIHLCLRHILCANCIHTRTSNESHIYVLVCKSDMSYLLYMYNYFYNSVQLYYTLFYYMILFTSYKTKINTNFKKVIIMTDIHKHPTRDPAKNQRPTTAQSHNYDLVSEYPSNYIHIFIYISYSNCPRIYAHIPILQQTAPRQAYIFIHQPWLPWSSYSCHMH